MTVFILSEYKSYRGDKEIINVFSSLEAAEKYAEDNGIVFLTIDEWEVR